MMVIVIVMMLRMIRMMMMVRMRMGGVRRTTTIFDARATKEEGAQILNKTILHAKDVKHIFNKEEIVVPFLRGCHYTID